MPETCRYIQVIIPLRLDWEPFYKLPEGVDVVVGDRVRVMFAGRRYIAVVSTVGVTPPPSITVFPIQSAESTALRIPETDISLWRQVATYYMCSVGEVYRMAGPPLRAEESDERRLQQKRAAFEKLVKAYESKRDRLLKSISIREEKLDQARESARTKPETIIRLQQEADNFKADLASLQKPEQALVEQEELKLDITLSPLQSHALECIHKGLAGGKPVLLHGVTGSGKTELYLTLAAEVLRAGGNVLYLVPEIALSRQLEDRIRTCVPYVQVYHSAETTGHKNAVVATMRRDEPYMVLGTRSALFLPHRGLMLVIVDEEHDTSYKQSSPAPCYHARETAVMLAKIHGAGIVLGSATPSLESLYNASAGRYVKVELDEPYYSGSSATVEIIDTVAETRKRGMIGTLSKKLIEALTETLAAGEQAVLLRSRRSYAPVLQCTACGHIPKCPSCNVALSYHKSPDQLVCHYCGRTFPYTGACSECGGELQMLGAGTQRVEEELRELFPSARIARIDSDTGADPEVIRSFAAGGIDILVGTQMITKGFDFAGVRLVAITQADNILGVQDFRADEYAIQLLTQFMGRCGRRGTPGRFLIQTREPAHPVFERLITSCHTEVSFCHTEAPQGPSVSHSLEERRLFNYPPYTRLIHLTLRESSPQRSRSLAYDLARSLPVSAIGPYTPPGDHIPGEFPCQLRISLPRDKSLLRTKEAIHASVKDFETRTHARVHIDVDPV
ncbi:MAG: primosomal protein N' [Bacteroidales bacterium]|nr:primosomal protein N' [Bacteroidales bacterium]